MLSLGLEVFDFRVMFLQEVGSYLLELISDVLMTTIHEIFFLFFGDFHLEPDVHLRGFDFDLAIVNARVAEPSR